MFRYILTAVAALLVLGIALKARTGEAAAPTPGPTHRIEAAKVLEVDGGHEITVVQRFAGRVSRASLVYDLKGQERTADEANSCARSLAEAPKMTEDRTSTTVQLSGRIPDGAHNVRIVVEDETGVKSLAIRY